MNAHEKSIHDKVIFEEENGNSRTYEGGQDERESMNTDTD